MNGTSDFSKNGVKKCLMLAGNFCFHALGYLAINAYLSRKNLTYDLSLALDRQIPFIKYFSPVYAIVYLLPVFAFGLCWHNYALIKAAAKAFALAGLLSFAVFVLYPVNSEPLRAVVGESRDVFGSIVHLFYGIDQPYNCFPSLHVALAFLAAMAVSRGRPSATVYIYTAAWLVALSTLFVKQHYVLDVVGGLAVAQLAGRLFMARIDKEAPTSP